MQDGKAELKGLDQELYQVRTIHLHHMVYQGEAMELLLLIITVVGVPQKIIKKKKVAVILIQTKKTIKKREEKLESQKM